jgi:hypothetical protein
LRRGYRTRCLQLHAGHPAASAIVRSAERPFFCADRLGGGRRSARPHHSDAVCGRSFGKNHHAAPPMPVAAEGSVSRGRIDRCGEQLSLRGTCETLDLPDHRQRRWHVQSPGYPRLRVAGAAASFNVPASGEAKGAVAIHALHSQNMPRELGIAVFHKRG